MSFKARLTANSSRLLLYPVDYLAETIQVVAIRDTDDPTYWANLVLGFPTDEFSYISLYRNNFQSRRLGNIILRQSSLGRGRYAHTRSKFHHSRLQRTTGEFCYHRSVDIGHQQQVRRSDSHRDLQRSCAVHKQPERFEIKDPDIQLQLPVADVRATALS